MSADDLDNEDYKFDDMDLLASDPEPDALTPGLGLGHQAGAAPESAARSSNAMALVLRNGLVVVGVVILLVIGYSVIESLLAQSKKSSLPGLETSASTNTSVDANEGSAVNSMLDTSLMNANANSAANSNAATANTSTTSVATTSSSSVSDSQWQGQLAGLQQQQQSISNNMSSMTNQLSGVNSSVNQLSSRFSQLNDALNALNAKLDQQSAEITRLSAMQKQMKQHAKKKPPTVVNQTMAYALQAVIPGRAWIVAPDGTTLTVRKGSQVTGYGVVRSIDAQQGLVMTSSGRVIQFSQADS